MGRTLVFDIGGTNIKYGVMDGEARLEFLREAPTEAELGGPAVLEKVLRLAGECGGFQRVGVSTAGQVNNRTGEIIYATDNIPGYTGTKVGETLERELGVPVAVENDVNAAAIGEAHYGAAKEFRHFLCITYGTGIGGAIFLDGELYTGQHGSAGELGHFVTHRGGAPCTCGFRGCYEAYASTGALARLAERAAGKPLNGREIFARFEQGDPGITDCIEQWLGEVAIGLAGLIHIFEPEAILLGGGIMQENYVLSRLREMVPQLIMASYRQVRLVPAALGNQAGLYGAFYAAQKK